MLEFIELKSPENKRTYVFPDMQVELVDVKRICVSSSGTHRLETADGKKHIVPKGWRHIILEMDAWTF